MYVNYGKTAAKFFKIIPKVTEKDAEKGEKYKRGREAADKSRQARKK
jgi:hypothetical protein